MDKLTIAWVDSGQTEGHFTQCLARFLTDTDIPVIDVIRISGIHIAQQRQRGLETWYDAKLSDWILWIDSDIGFTTSDVEKLWEIKNAVHRPIVSGIYFNYRDNALNGPFSPIIPIVFNVSAYENRMVPVDIENTNEIIPIDIAGFGFVLFHRSLITKMAELYENKFLFNEEQKTGDQFVGEDVSFFLKVKKCGVQTYAHTGVLLEHIKKRTLSYKDYANSKLRN